MLRHNVHGHFCKIHIRADAGRRGDGGFVEDPLDDFLRQIVRAFAVSTQVPGDIHEYLVNGIDVNVLRSHILQIDAVDFRTDGEIVRHAGFGDVHACGEIRIGLQLIRLVRFADEHASWRRLTPSRVDLLEFCFDFEQPRTPGKPVLLQ